MVRRSSTVTSLHAGTPGAHIVLRIRATAAGTLTAVRAENARPRVDVVVPFAGSEQALRELVARLRGLNLRDGDTLTVVDNRPAGSPPVDGVLRAPERQSSYFARNRGAAAGSNPWLVFLDADVVAPPELIDRYLVEPPRERTAVLAGGVVDEPLDERASPVARYTAIRASMSQANTLVDERWGYAQTANCAVRRSAFEAVGGFRSDVRSGGDADLCFRLRAQGWQIEPRDGAAVVHRSRTTLGKLLRQRARHGAGAGWLAREHPGAFPRKRWLGLAKWTATSFASAAVARVRGRRDEALVGLVEPLWVWTFELGRFLPNEVSRRG
jgi:GT2 family glycosyltransferase